MDFMPSVLQAIAGEGYMVYAYLNDGTVRLVDVAHLIERGGVFDRIADEGTFRDALTVLNQTVAWDVEGNRDPCACIDLDPITIYEEAPIVRDPLSDRVA